MTSGLFRCIASRASIVLVLNSLINVCVFVNVEQTLGQMWKKVCFLFRQLNRNNNHADTSISIMKDADDDDDDAIMMYGRRNRNIKAYLTSKTQMILFSAGIRGVVSYAFVQNIPVYDAVTKTRVTLQR
jgi:hypothetical protein